MAGDSTEPMIVPESLSKGFPPLWKETPDDREAMKFNEYLKFRFAVSFWTDTTKPMIDGWKSGYTNPQVRQGIRDLFAYNDALGKTLAVIDASADINEIRELRSVTNDVFTKICGDKNPAQNGERPDETNQFIDDESILKHDLFNGLMEFDWTEYGADFSKDTKSALQESIDKIQKVSRGELVPELFTFQQLQEMIQLQLERTAPKHAIQVDLFSTIDEAMRDHPVTWSRIHVYRLLGNILQNLDREYLEKTDGRNLTVTLDFDPTNDFQQIYFDDNGPGYDPAFLEKKNPFRKGLSKHKQRNGSGLGMYGIQKSLVETFGGYITAENRTDESNTILGGRLTVAIPTRN